MNPLAPKVDAPGIRIADVSHVYNGSRAALEDVSLSIPDGLLTGLIGPDGVGKSTLLGLITGAKRLQSGRVEVFGGDIGQPDHRRQICPRIAYMPQGLGRNLYGELTILENLDFFGRLFRVGTERRAARIDMLLSATGLAPFRDRPVAKLSGGMKQKLGLCCALIHDPDLLVLDEPTTGVDPLSRIQFWSLIASIRTANPGMTVLVSTAYMDEAGRFDYLAAMDGGRILKTGSPADFMAAAGTASLEDAYRALRPDEESGSDLEIPPLGDRAGPPVIVAEALTKRFGDFTAVDAVSFEIREGEIFGFLGSNGCGKSTTMKMLTGLLPASSGNAVLLGASVASHGQDVRHLVGYMSQGFSLYGELTARQNLDLHARVFGLDGSDRMHRIRRLTDRFGLSDYLDQVAGDLPLGVRQRLSLAVAVIHKPRVLILDEPTSGVDPAARDMFWRLLVELSRRDGVTIFISTHFMSEAERCDRVSLMHAGKVLACDTPAKLMADADVDRLEEAFVARLRAPETAERQPEADPPVLVTRPSDTSGTRIGPISLDRLSAYARRESIEAIRDPVRLAFAFIGSVVLMILFCFGISLDIEDLSFATIDLDRSPESRAYIAMYEGSRYFTRTADLTDSSDGHRRLVGGDVSLTLEIPPDFGERLKAGGVPSVLATVDGAIPFKGETVEGYVAGIHSAYLQRLARENSAPEQPMAEIHQRFRYNQSFESIYAMAPAMPAILLILLPAILTAVSVARERELGSITNFYVTPTTRLEFLVGKQTPYLAIAYLNFLLLSGLTEWGFGVPLKGDLLPLLVGALLYVWASTAFGLVISTVTSSQVAAVFATALSSIIPTIQFSGLLQPVSTLEGAARILGTFWPASHFLHLNVGAFTKGLGWSELYLDILALAAFGPAFTLIAILSLRTQER